MNEDIVKRLIKKAHQSPCRFRVGAVALNDDGVLGYSYNIPTRHAEDRLIAQYKGAINTIVIVRVGNSGRSLPIDPCNFCAKLCKKYDINIYSLEKIT